MPRLLVPRHCHTGTWLNGVGLTALRIVLLMTFVMPLWLAQPGHASSLSPAVYAALEQAQNLLAEGKREEALPHLEKWLERTRQGSLDRAMTWQLIGHAHTDAGQDQAAIDAYQQALQQNSLPASLQRAVIGNLAQLHIRQQQYLEGLTLLERWLTAQEASAEGRKATSPELYMLAAHAAVQLDRYARALPHAKTAFARHANPPESWYQMLIGLHLHLEQRAEARQRLYQVIARFAPKKRYWRQLNALYLADQDLPRALQSWQLAEQAGLFDDAQDWYHLANLYANHQQPFQAAQALEAGRRAGKIAEDSTYWRRLAGYWQAARERDQAIAAMHALAAATADVNDYVRLAQLLMAEERWSEAEQVLKSATDHASEARLDELHYWQGLALYEQGQHQRAGAAFARISTAGVFTERAQKWRDFLSSQAATD